MLQQIPLDSSHNQTFQCVLAIDGVNRTLQFFIRWNEMAEYWVMSITDPIENALLLDSIPLITGNYPAANILAPYKYMKIGSAYLINIGGVSADPAIDDLGTNFTLYWSDTP